MLTVSAQSWALCWFLSLSSLGQLATQWESRLQSCDEVHWGPHSSHKGRDSWFSATLPGAFEDAGPVGEDHDSQG